MDFILKNSEWIFSGIGVFLLSFFLIRKKVKPNKNKVRQKIKNHSVGIQAGRDVNIGAKNDSSES